jgi:site-specific DNA-methyltransferase (adenine-specific)
MRPGLVTADAVRLPIADGVIDLTVTSPPYDLNKPYGSSDSHPYADYLSWSRAWLAELHRATSVGGRLCLNIPLDTNLGGKRSVYADLTGVARGVGWGYHTTIVWNEQNISRRTAWGSWCKATAPFVTAPVEMIVVLFKDAWKRDGTGRVSTVTPDEFKAWTLGLWTFPGESAKRIGHPAPFPEELPRRCIRLYSFADDVVADVFSGAGTTVKVASELGRRAVGIDLSGDYSRLASKRAAGPPLLKVA